MTNPIPCLVCGSSLDVRVAKSRRAKNPKLFLMLVCPRDGRHFRGFVQDREYVDGVLHRLSRVSGSQEVACGGM